MKKWNFKDKIKTIDPRGLEHHEKEKLIFPSIEDLSKGDSLEWILVVKRIAVEETRKEKLEAMVQKLKRGDISEERM